ncbi:MAG: NAD(+) diphosphatase [Burkholderiales bacterium]|nr:NAD(+) diphosphatase [Burkholderiales bacterium]
MQLINQQTDFNYFYDVNAEVVANDLIFVVDSKSKIFMIDNDIPIFDGVAKLLDSIVCQFGVIGSQKCFIARLNSDLSDCYNSIRSSYKLLDISKFKAMLLANHLTTWINSHKYCGVCSGINELIERELFQKCKSCGNMNYPTVSPCVIGAIYDQDKILLARSPHFASNVYSCVAGFVSPGENIEQAFAREVMEEVGLSIKNIQYIASQPWPFPHSLMMGFIAEYDSGELKIDYNELEDARWFSIDELGDIILPSELSIASFLIEQVVNKYRLNKKSFV